MNDQVNASRVLEPIRDTWPRLLRHLKQAMPTLPDIRVSNLRAVADELPSFEVSLELARIWASGFAYSIASAVSRWLAERLREDGDSMERERFFELLAHIIPNFIHSGPLVAKLEMVGGRMATPYLLCVARHPTTSEVPLGIAREYLEMYEQLAHPHGEGLPVEIWRMRGRRLARIRRLYIVEGDGPAKDQMLELAFADGAAAQLWAGYGHEMRIEMELYEEETSGDHLLEVAGADEVTRIANHIVVYLLDDSDYRPVKSAVGRMLTDFRALYHGGILNGLQLRFETAVVTLKVIDDLQFDIRWEEGHGQDADR